MRTQVVFWLLAAIDGHAKNFSISLLAGSGFQLTPRYDILSAHPFMGHGHEKLAVQKMKMAMAVEGKSRHHHWQGIRLKHWLETAKRCGFAGMEGVIDELIVMTPEVIGRVRAKIPANFPESIAYGIFEGTQNAARELGKELLCARGSK